MRRVSSARLSDSADEGEGVFANSNVTAANATADSDCRRNDQGDKHEDEHDKHEDEHDKHDDAWRRMHRISRTLTESGKDPHDHHGVENLD